MILTTMITAPATSRYFTVHDRKKVVKDQIAYLGEHACGQLAAILHTDRPLRVFAVLDPQAYVHSGATDVVEHLFQQHVTTRFTDFKPNPKLEDVIQGIELYRQAQPELVIAIGGGTTIDMAKLIRTLTDSPHPEAVIRSQAPIVTSNVRFIAVPTTAGTGSEATQFAVVYIDGEKFSLDHPSIRPDIAIVDSLLMHTLPPSVTAATGLDAFCQAIESIWAVGATAESVSYAREAAALAFKHLPHATNNPTPESRQAMCRASYLAGKAINITRTTAAHALSYPVTSHYRIPHGMAVSLTIGPILAYNAAVTDADCMDVRGVHDVQRRIAMILEILDAADAPEGCARIACLLAELGCPRSLQEAGIESPQALRNIIDVVNVQRLSNNPRRATAASLFELLFVAPEYQRRQQQEIAVPS